MLLLIDAAAGEAPCHDQRDELRVSIFHINAILCILRETGSVERLGVIRLKKFANGGTIEVEHLRAIE